MFLAIDRVSKFTYVEFHDSAGKMEGSAFLKAVVEVFPYKIHTVLTDNGMAFADLPKNREGPSRRFLGPHIFDRVCMKNGIDHRLTKPYHPWTNGQAERMNRTIKDATVKVFHYDDLHSLKARPGLRHRLQLRQALEGPEMANTLSGHLRGLDESSRNLQNQPAPPHSGTTHLVDMDPMPDTPNVKVIETKRKPPMWAVKVGARHRATYMGAKARERAIKFAEMLTFSGKYELVEKPTPRRA